MTKIIEGNVSIDDRGKLSFVNEFDFKKVKRFYVVENHQQGFVRAWHGHKKEGKYVYCVSGSVLIGVVDMKSEELKTFVLSSDNPEILWIPPGNYNGFKTLTDDAKLMFFSTSTLGQSKGDDIRQPWDKWNIWGVQPR